MPPKQSNNVSLRHALAHREPLAMLAGMNAAMHVAHASWMVLITNFAYEAALFDGEQMGWLHGIREIPGFLAFSTVALLILFREQTLALISLVVLAAGVALTGFFPQLTGIFVLTFITSLGFHLFHTIQQSLSLQWLPKKIAPAALGTVLASGAVVQFVAYAGAYFSAQFFDMDFLTLFLIAGAISLVIITGLIFAFPTYKSEVPQTHRLVLRREYWLYYALVFLSGARRQIFIVFAVFLLVEKFSFTLSEVALLYLLNCTITTALGRAIGNLIHKFGERNALILEYCGLVIVFSTYALVESALLAGALYVVDNLLFSMSIALATYFQKIGRPEDFASTAAVSFSINHIAAVALPPILGGLWLFDPSLVFWAGTALALMSLIASTFIPRFPDRGQETTLVRI